MGFKKGRAARAAASAASAAAADCAGGGAADGPRVQHDGACVTYTAASGAEYRIDVAAMEQLDTGTGMRRAVFRKPGPGKTWLWEFHAATEGARNYTPPRCITVALEQRWRALQAERGDGSEEAAASARWRRALAELDDGGLRELLDLLGTPGPSAFDIQPGARNDDDDLAELASAVAADEFLRQALVDRLLRTAWPADRVAGDLRCLLRRGLRPTPAHCRLAAITRGSLALLRVLLVEAAVDVCGLVLFEPGLGKKSQAEKNWASGKEALKALMARGAVLGSHAPPSKLLRKLAEDGNALWTERALSGFARAHPELPDCVLPRVRAFL